MTAVGAAGTKETVWDQHIYNDVVESAVFGKEMHRRSHQRMVRRCRLTQ